MVDLKQRAGDEDSGAKEKAERDARWVGDWSDALTVAIALREWGNAVVLVEEGQSRCSSQIETRPRHLLKKNSGKAKLATIPPLTTKLPALTQSLVDALLQALSYLTNRKSDVVSLISWLVRLQAGPAARNTFLETRSKVISDHIRAIRFEGHIGMYIGELSVVVFTGIKHTADWFLASFKENEVASGTIASTERRRNQVWLISATLHSFHRVDKEAT